LRISCSLSARNSTSVTESAPLRVPVGHRYAAATRWLRPVRRVNMAIASRIGGLTEISLSSRRFVSADTEAAEASAAAYALCSDLGLFAR